MAEKKVSVVIPTYNRPLPLSEALESLANQTYPLFEVIVVNDGGEAMDHVTNLYPELNVRLLHQDKNSGHVRARNIGVQAAKGEYILLLDDDDMIMPQHVEKMLAEIEEADAVYCDAEVYQYEWDEQGRVPTEKMLFAYEYDPQLLRKYLIIIPSGTLYRRTVHERIGGYFDEEVHNYWDWDFFLRLTTHCRLKRLPVASTLYAFASYEGDHQSAHFSEKRENYLRRLCEKHHLGELPMENFYTMLNNQELKVRQAATQRLWDGSRVISRYAQYDKQQQN